MPVFGKRVDIPGGRRRAVREQVLLGAAAITIENSQSVIVEDVCPSGARLRGRNPPRLGAQLLLKAGEMQVLASVAWLDGDDYGITFDMPLDQEGVQLLKQEGRWARILGIDPAPVAAGEQSGRSRGGLLRR